LVVSGSPIIKQAQVRKKMGFNWRLRLIEIQEVQLELLSEMRGLGIKSKIAEPGASLDAENVGGLDGQSQGRRK
jgi:hypothetical protein